MEKMDVTTSKTGKSKGGKKSTAVKKQQPPVAKKMPKAKVAVTEIRCTLCSVVLNSMSNANDHFNSKAHETKCARKYLHEKKIAEEEAASRYFCATCDVHLPDENGFKMHLESFKHNYKLNKGNFDPKSPFAARAQKMKEKLAKLKMLKQQKKLNKE